MSFTIKEILTDSLKEGVSKTKIHNLPKKSNTKDMDREKVHNSFVKADSSFWQKTIGIIYFLYPSESDFDRSQRNNAFRNGSKPVPESELKLYWSRKNNRSEGYYPEHDFE